MQLTAIACSLCLLTAAADPGNGPSRKSPNVVLIMCDQLSAHVLNGYGGPVPTPHIDRLAREGVRFTQAVCPTPFCSPTRASIITGMYPHAHGIVVNCRHGTASGPPGITADDVTTEKLLHTSGYATHQYGKWHLFGDRLPYYPDMYDVDGAYLREMQDTFARVRKSPRSDWMEWYIWPLPVRIAPAIRQAARNLEEPWKDQRFADFILKMGRLELPLKQNFDVRVADLTVERIRALTEQRRPFMVTCSFNGPHDPNVVPSPYYEAFDPDRIELPRNLAVREKRFEKDWSRQIVAGLGESGLREFLRIYYGSIRLLDDQVGRVLDALDAAGVADDTIVVFTADHGDMAGGHGMVWKSTSAFYDEIVRVPLIIRYPRKLQPARSDLVVDLTDLMPTLLDLLGRPIPPQVQGQSVIPFLTGGRDPAQARRYAFSERISRDPQVARGREDGIAGSFMIRGQGWKYIRYDRGPDRQFLYRLTDDPGETRNLANDPRYADKARELSGEIDAWLDRTSRAQKAGPARRPATTAPRARRPVQTRPRTDLPNVLIIGDSISLGYTPFVQELLKDRANVVHPKANCGDTRRGLADLDQWLGDTRWDVIHFNWGLHDLCYRNPDSKVQGGRDKVKGVVSVPVQQYETNLEKLVCRLERTGATLIWASTTVVPEGEAGRIVGDDEKYNQAAARVMKARKIATNDLHALTRALPSNLFMAPGNVHYIKDGYRRIAEQVAASIDKALKEKAR